MRTFKSVCLLLKTRLCGKDSHTLPHPSPPQPPAVYVLVGGSAWNCAPRPLTVVQFHPRSSLHLSACRARGQSSRRLRTTRSSSDSTHEEDGTLRLHCPRLAPSTSRRAGQPENQDTVGPVSPQAGKEVDKCFRESGDQA